MASSELMVCPPQETGCRGSGGGDEEIGASGLGARERFHRGPRGAGRPEGCEGGFIGVRGDVGMNGDEFLYLYNILYVFCVFFFKIWKIFILN